MPRRYRLLSEKPANKIKIVWYPPSTQLFSVHTPDGQNKLTQKDLEKWLCENIGLYKVFIKIDITSCLFCAIGLRIVLLATPDEAANARFEPILQQ